MLKVARGNTRFAYMYLCIQEKIVFSGTASHMYMYKKCDHIFFSVTSQKPGRES